MVARAQKSKGTILVTGASRGLGFEFARQYAEDGWHVIATCRAPEKAAQLKKLMQGNDNITLFQLDVTDAKSIARLAKGLKGAAIDVLLNNAGVVGKAFKKTGKEISLNKVDYQEFARVVDSNFYGPLRVTEALLKNVQRSKIKKIANISSRSGSIAGVWSDAVAYSVSKASLNCAMRAFARDLKPAKVTVINLCPGWTRTDMTSPKATHAAPDSVQRLKKIIDKTALKDTGRFVDRDGKDIPW